MPELNFSQCWPVFADKNRLLLSIFLCIFNWKSCYSRILCVCVCVILSNPCSILWRCVKASGEQTPFGLCQKPLETIWRFTFVMRTSLCILWFRWGCFQACRYWIGSVKNIIVLGELLRHFEAVSGFLRHSFKENVAWGPTMATSSEITPVGPSWAQTLPHSIRPPPPAQQGCWKEAWPRRRVRRWCRRRSTTRRPKVWGGARLNRHCWRRAGLTPGIIFKAKFSSFWKVFSKVFFKVLKLCQIF